MDGRGSDEESLTLRIEELQRERDELRKDIELLCMQQAGPGYLAVATRMHFQRTAGLEQEIDSLKKKLVGLTRDKQNLQEELSEAYQIKTQLADLHSAEVLKNKEVEKQVKFFQSCVAAAFSERDHSLMESEKAKEQVDAMSQELIDSENRLAELQSAYQCENKLNVALQTELKELQEQNELFEKVISKFCDVRERDTGFYLGQTWQDKCSCLLDDPSDKWIFNSDSVTSTSKYIASLEQELETLRKKIDKLQKNMQMGLEIEQHLKRNVRSLEQKQNMLDGMIQNGLSTLRDFYSQQRFEVAKLLEEETSNMNSLLMEAQNKMSKIHMNSELKFEARQAPQREDPDDAECRDVHISNDVESNVLAKKSGLPTASFISNRTPDASDALAQALQEKVAALLLLSQQEERYLLDKDVNAALQEKIEELQRNLSQVTNEKVKALLEMAQLRRDYQLLWENGSPGLKQCNFQADGSERTIIVHEREGKLKNLLKGTYLRKWMGKDFSEHEADFHEITDGNNPTNKKTYSSMEFARLKVENAALRESMANMEHLTSSIHRLRVSLLKAQEDAMSAAATDGPTEALSNIIQESNHVKTALGGSLPVSWSADSTDAITYQSLYDPTDPSGGSRSEKVNAVSVAGFEMAELLILAAQLLRTHIAGESAADPHN